MPPTNTEPLTLTAHAHRLQFLADGAASWGLPIPDNVVFGKRALVTLFFDAQEDFDAWVEKTDAGPLEHSGGRFPSSSVYADMFDVDLRLTFDGLHSTAPDACSCGRSCCTHADVVSVPLSGVAQ